MLAGMKIRFCVKMNLESVLNHVIDTGMSMCSGQPWSWQASRAQLGWPSTRDAEHGVTGPLVPGPRRAGTLSRDTKLSPRSLDMYRSRHGQTDRPPKAQHPCTKMPRPEKIALSRGHSMSKRGNPRPALTWSDL